MSGAAQHKLKLLKSNFLEGQRSIKWRRRIIFIEAATANVMITIIFINNLKSIRHRLLATKARKRHEKTSEKVSELAHICKMMPVPFKLNGFHNRLLC